MKITSQLSSTGITPPFSDRQPINPLLPFLQKIFKSIEKRIPSNAFKWTNITDCCWEQEVKPCLLKILTNLPAALMEGSTDRLQFSSEQKERINTRLEITKQRHVALRLASYIKIARQAPDADTFYHDINELQSSFSSDLSEISNTDFQKKTVEHQEKVQKWQNEVVQNLSKKSFKQCSKIVSLNELGHASITNYVIDALQSSNCKQLKEAALLCWPQEELIALTRAPELVNQAVQGSLTLQDNQELATAYVAYLFNKKPNQQDCEQVQNYFDYLLSKQSYKEAVYLLHGLGGLSHFLPMDCALTLANRLIEKYALEKVDAYLQEELLSLAFCLTERHKEMWKSDLQQPSYSLLKPYLEKVFSFLAEHSPSTILKLLNDIEKFATIVGPQGKEWGDRLACDILEELTNRNLNASIAISKKDAHTKLLFNSAKLLKERAKYADIKVDFRFIQKLYNSYAAFEEKFPQFELQPGIKNYLAELWLKICFATDWESGKTEALDLWTRVSKKWLCHAYKAHLRLINDGSFLNFCSSLAAKDGANLFYKVFRRALLEVYSSYYIEPVTGIQHLIRFWKLFVKALESKQLTFTGAIKEKLTLNISWLAVYLLSRVLDTGTQKKCWQDFTKLIFSKSSPALTLRKLPPQHVSLFIDNIVNENTADFFFKEVIRFLKLHHQTPLINYSAFKISFLVLNALQMISTKLEGQKLEAHRKKLNTFENELAALLGKAFETSFDNISDELNSKDRFGPSHEIYTYFSYLEPGTPPFDKALDAIVSSIIRTLPKDNPCSPATDLGVFLYSLFWPSKEVTETDEQRLKNCEIIFTRLLEHIKYSRNYAKLYTSLSLRCNKDLMFGSRTNEPFGFGIATITCDVLKAIKKKHPKDAEMTNLALNFLRLGFARFEVTWSNFKSEDDDYKTIDIRKLYKLTITYLLTLQSLFSSPLEIRQETKQTFLADTWLSIIRIASQLANHLLVNGNDELSSQEINNKSMASTLLRMSCNGLINLTKKDVTKECGNNYSEAIKSFSSALNLCDDEPIFNELQWKRIALWLYPHNDISETDAKNALLMLRIIRTKLWQQPQELRAEIFNKANVFFKRFPELYPQLQEVFLKPEEHTTCTELP